MDAHLLKSVSRTFYLTLKALPRPFREPVSLAYLLARATDTIADTSTVPSSIRLDLLDQLSHLIASPHSLQNDAVDFGKRLTLDFSPAQSNAAEAELLRRTDELLADLRGHDPFHQNAIRNVLAEIITGQKEDLSHFPSDGTIHALPDAEALDRYTRLVAGCVGEFWTRLGYHTYGTRYSRTPETKLVPAGVRLGKGLQLVNILRDLPEDLAAGRCYLPANELATAGLTFPIPIPQTDSELAGVFSQIRPVAESWLESCSHHLDQGLEYTVSLRHRRLRFATALPLNFAARTSALLKNVTDSEWLSRTKISRSEIKKIAKKTALCFFSSRPQQALYRELAT